MKTVIMDIMKRSFTELSKESQIILGIIITIITIWEISAFLNMIERKRRWYLLSLAVGILIFSTILMQGLADLARCHVLVCPDHWKFRRHIWTMWSGTEFHVF